MRILAAAIGATLLQQAALAQTLTLEGPYWGDPAAWSGGQLPTSQQDVDATSTCGGSCVSLSIRTLQGAAIQASAGDVDATGRQIGIGPGASLNVASLQASGVTMTGGQLTARGGTIIPGTTTIRSNGTLGASLFTGGGTFQLGDVTFIDGSLELRGTGSMVNPQTGVMAIRNNQTDFDRTGSIDLYFEYSFTNAGVMDFQGPSQLGNFPSPGTAGTSFFNMATGAIEASDPLSLGLPTVIAPQVGNDGRIAVSSGTLRLAGGGRHAGFPVGPAGTSAVLDASGTGVLELLGDHTIAGIGGLPPGQRATVNVTGSGVVQLGGFFTPATMAVESDAVLATSVAQFFQNAPLTVRQGGTALNSGGFYAFDTLAVEDGATLVNQGFMQLAATLENAGVVEIAGAAVVLGQGSYLQSAGRTTIDTAALVDLTIVPGQEGSFQQFDGSTTVDGLLRAGDIAFLGGTVAGSGTIEYVNSLNVDGAVLFGPGLTVRPGNSPGVLTINGNLEAAGAIFDIEIAGRDAGTLFDQLVVNGHANLDGATVNFQFIDGFLPTAGDLFDWLVTSGGAFGLDTATVRFFSDAGTIDGFLESDGRLFINTVTPIPLPPAAWTLGAALLALGSLARRRAASPPPA
jgi:hypothetical protein